jgi:hypothetical protein
MDPEKWHPASRPPTLGGQLRALSRWQLAGVAVLFVVVVIIAAVVTL